MAFLVGALLGIFLSTLLELEDSDEATLAEQELTEFHSRLQLGMSTSELLYRFAEGHYGNLRLDLVDGSPSERTLLVSTPLRMGAMNWVLHVAFADDRVSALQVRTLDSDRVRPDGAPEDIVARDGVDSANEM